MGFNELGNCSGVFCGYGVAGGRINCDAGNGSCWGAFLLKAEISPFHDKQLSEATEKIKEILEAIPADPEGRKLSFVHTAFGTVLAWVNHDQGYSAGSAVTINDDAEKVAAALGIIEAG